MMKPAEPSPAPHPAPERAAGGYAAINPGDELLTVKRRDELVHWWEQMLLIRLFEEACAEQYTRARIGGYLHLNVGEEASVVGAIAALGPDDYVFSNYREHGHAIARGVDPRRIMAELFGKATGIVKGRGGSMHIFDSEKHFMGGYAIVGASIPLAVGAGLAIRYRDSSAVVMSIFGEGATNIGAFHESMNLAELWKLPIVFICTNNLYAMGKKVEEDSAVTEIWKKARAYDMAAERVDGMDLLAVHAATARAIDRARREHRPYFLETLTYRYRTHSMADAGRYRTADEVDQWRHYDPIVTFRAKLERAGLLPSDEADQIEQQTEQRVAECVRFAEESPFPDLSTLYDDVYCGPDPRQEC